MSATPATRLLTHTRDSDASGMHARMLPLPFEGTRDARSLNRMMQPQLARFGFDSLSYFVTSQVSGIVTGDMLWTTLPRAWAAQYREQAYVAIDPRLAPLQRRIAPFLWEAGECGSEWRVRRFLADAQRQGIASGAVISLHDSPGRWVTVTFDSRVGPVSPARREVLAAHLGDLLLLAIALHERLLARPVAHRRHRRTERVLTFRESDCLALAARGLTSADIGARLSVAERTVNFHFRNIKTKLGAINRPEAIARGISLGLIGTGDGRE
ncbi:MAG: LuxR family transcriptional regulator [Casimicrobiaceae bacterium]